jgi:RNA polymerase sigma factor (sigma-70 family)
MYDAIPDDAAQAGFAAAESEVFLVALLDTVPEPARSALALRYLVNLSQREVAHRLGLSERNASTTIGRALERLRVRRAAADFV